MRESQHTRMIGRRRNTEFCGGRVLQIILVVLLCCLTTNCQDCTDKNCAYCPTKTICKNCYSGYTLDQNSGVCTAIIYCAVKNCDVCPSSTSSVCTRCVSGYDLNSSATSCVDSEKQAMSMFLIGGLISFVAFVLIICCVARRRKMLQQRNYRDSDINSVITQDDHGVVQMPVATGYPPNTKPLAHLNRNTNQPPLPPAPAAPHPAYQSYAAGPPPPPGNSLLFAHRGV